MLTRVTAFLFGMALASGALAQGSSISHVGVLQADTSRARQSGVLETDTTSLFGLLFLEEVNHGDQPHSQAFFLERAASLAVAYADLDVEAALLGSTSGKVSGFDLQYITEGSLVVGGGYSRVDIDNISATTTHNVEIGYYHTDTSRFLLTYANADNDFAFLADSTTKTYGLEYKNVTVHPSMTTALTLDMKYNHVDAAAGSGNLWEVQGEYHFTLASSLLAGVQVTTGVDKGTQYNLGFMQFLTRFFAVGAEFTRKEPDSGTHTNTVAVRARMLF